MLTTAKPNLKIVIGLSLVVLVGLMLVSPLASMMVTAQYSNQDTEYQGSAATPKAVGAGTTYAWSLEAPAYNSSSYWTLVINGTTITGTEQGVFTSVGSYTGNSTFTVTGLTANHHWYGKITYYYELPVAQATLLGLVPLFVVIMILLSVIVCIWELLKYAHSA